MSGGNNLVGLTAEVAMLGELGGWESGKALESTKQTYSAVWAVRGGSSDCLLTCFGRAVGDIPLPKNHGSGQGFWKTTISKKPFCPL